MTYRFFYSPGACSLGTHVLLEEVGAPFESTRIDLAAGEQNAPQYRAINPKGKVPALLRADGSLLTEYQAIAWWLARAHPDANLLPNDVERQIRIMELLDYMVGTVHMRGFTFIAVPHRFTAEPSAQADLRRIGTRVAGAGLALLGEKLAQEPWLDGDFSIADSALFYLTSWAGRSRIDLPANLQGFHDRMLARPATQRALAREEQAA